MKFRRSYLLVPVVLVLLGALLFAFLRLNRYQTEGELKLPGLHDPVTVFRDEKGMPYIYASNSDDLLTALGFVTAQDRLFQMELIRRYAQGRLSEFAGEETAELDVRMRTLGFHRHAKRFAGRLDAQSRRSIESYLRGVNAFITRSGSEHPIEFKLAGIKAEPWDIADSLSILYFMSWSSSGNLDTEIIAQALVEKLGVEEARRLFPLNINPDDPGAGIQSRPGLGNSLRGFASDRKLLGLLEERPLRVGSNNWVVGPRRSASGRPTVANDPHLDARVLPGPWYTFGLISPSFRWVGASIPGIPGSNIGRNDHIAIGVTNAYGDIQDLYIETIDPASPERYLEGRRSIPFETIPETILIRDKSSSSGMRAGMRERRFQVRLTHRGPVVSDVLAGLDSRKVVTLRWAPFELAPPSNLDALMKARSVGEVRDILSRLDFFALNFVFADRDGNIGWAASGKLPIRRGCDGTIPCEVREEKDNWAGWIPFDRMPQAYNPERGWLGTCNHYTVAKDFPYYYSSFASPSYRYRRLSELMTTPAVLSADDHWRHQRDTMNLMARKVAPVIVSALNEEQDTRRMGEVLARWNFEDRADLAAPTVFQAVYTEFARIVFQEKLGAEAAALMLKSWYFWEERLEHEVLAGPLSGGKAGALFRRAARSAQARYGPALGEDPAQWLWGKAHQIEFVNPIRRKGFGKELLGASYPMAGSGETLYRAVFDFKDPFGVSFSASLRMVADLGDPDKVLAVLPGGVSGRTLHPHTKDQLDAFMNGEKRYWWFSDRAIREHAKSTLLLLP